MKQHEEWLSKAEGDLKSSKTLYATGDETQFDSAIYHTQQCAEKALKACIVSHGKAVEKTHNLRAILEVCIEFDTSFESLLDLVVKVNPYGTIFRYPGEIMHPTADDVQEAIDATEQIFSHVTKKIL